MSEDDVDQDRMAAEWAAAMGEETSSQDDIDAILNGGPDTTPPRMPLEDLGTAPAAEQSSAANPSLGQDLDVILDIPVRIAMEVGNTEISIRNLLQLNQGSVVELDRLAGEPLDVLVNGTLIAHGEVVVVNEKFGIRMTDVISPSERIKKLR